jgi:hypothetical protein
MKWPMRGILIDNHSSDEGAKVIALLTCLMSIPLFFPPARLNGLLLNWWLLGIYAVPTLIILGLIILFWSLLFSGTLSRPSLRWNLLGIFVGVLAETVEIIFVRMLPKLP